MFLRCFVLFAAIFVTGAAQAQNNWNSPGSACVPASDGSSVVRHTTNISSVRFATGAVGQIVLICPMSRFNSGTSSYVLKLTYVDSSGTGTTSSVIAQAYMMANETDNPVLLATAKSNNSAATGLNTVASPVFSHTYDFEANTYWIRVLIRRDATNETAIFHSAVLDGQSF